MVGRAGQNLAADPRVLGHDLPLVGVELAWLDQDAVRNADLPDVVHGGRPEKGIHVRLCKAEPPRHRRREAADPEHMLTGILVSVLGRPRQPDDGLERTVPRLLQRFLQLGRAGENLLL